MQENEEQFIVQIKININALLCQLCLKSYLNIDTKVHISLHLYHFDFFSLCQVPLHHSQIAPMWLQIQIMMDLQCMHHEQI